MPFQSAVSQSTMGSRIEEARLATNMSLPQLARRIGVKAQTLENWENDRSEPRAEKITKLAGILRVPIIWLLAGEALESVVRAPSPSETAQIAMKLARAIAMQQNLASLLSEVSADVSRLQRDLDEEQELVA